MKTATYREPPTPGGLEKMEKGELKWFDTEMYGNLNTGILEEYLEEKNRVESFRIARWSWGKIGIGIVIGTIFAIITEYVGLKVGIAVSGGWYVAYLIGLGLKWKPSEINLMSAACDAATMICTGFIFTFPALYLLAYSPDFAIGVTASGEPAFLIKNVPPIAVVLVATIVSGWLGIMYFIIFRRLWLVEDPLHLPGFEPLVKLLDIAKDITGGAVEQARRSIRIVLLWSTGTGIFTFLRDMPVVTRNEEHISLLDAWFGGEYYRNGEIMQPTSTAHYTFFSFAILPIQIGIGWFMKFRVAFLMSLGSFLTWFLVVPLAVSMGVPIFDIEMNAFVRVSDYAFASWMAYRKIGAIIGIGAILGGGMVAIVKMFPMFKDATKDVRLAFRKDQAEESKDYIRGRGWYEWPVSHIPLMLGVTFVVVSLVFILGGYPVAASLVFAGILCASTFFLGAIAVKTFGETGTEPVSATSIIVLLMLIGIFYFLMGMPAETSAVMAIIGTTVFAGAISMSGSIIWDFKVGGYVGNRPYDLTRAVVTAIVPGAVLAAIGAGILSYGLATGVLNLLAPQAKVFATLNQIIFSGQSNALMVQYIAIGAAIGVCAEIMTGMGTAFGLGMYFPLSIQLPFLLGGFLRDFWEKRYLEPRAKKENWDERKRTLVVLDSYMAATGLMVGEAVMATVAAIVMVGLSG